MKKIDKLILTSFIGPYILSFFIAEFVLIMQFLWKYIDDILGKGFTMIDVMELVVYYGLTILPMALPISILLASIMVYGDISEKYELASMKSAGISLLRVMRPAIVLAVVTAFISLVASNYIKPAATFQFKKRFDLIKRQKSTLTIEEGIFNDEFRDFAIRVEKKEAEGPGVENIIIYDHTMPDRSLVNFIKAECGEMYSTDDGNYFVINLREGEQYQELERKVENGKVTFPFIRTKFDQWSKVFDMRNFYLNESDISINRSREDMLNTFQLLTQIDTFNTKIEEGYKKIKNDFGKIQWTAVLSPKEYEKQMRRKSSTHTSVTDSINKNPQFPANVLVNKDSVLRARRKLSKGFINEQSAVVIKSQELKALEKVRSKNFPTLKAQPIYVQKSDSLNKSATWKKPAAAISGKAERKQGFDLGKTHHFYETIDSLSLIFIIEKAVQDYETELNFFGSAAHSINHHSFQREVYLLRLGQQYSFALVCILFLFIGAPLGSIIRKGGYGYPLLIAIIFYMMFIISTIVGEKLLKNELISGLTGAWMPCLILLPFSFYFTFLAVNDARFLWLERLGRWLNKWLTPKEKQPTTA